MTKLTEHFSLGEFTRSGAAWRLRLDNSPTPEARLNLEHLAMAMEKVRTACGNRSISITSGYRNRAVNKAVGGIPTSAHALGYACDFTVSGLEPKEAAKKIIAAKIKFDQLIWEVSRNILHISIDPRNRQQVLTQAGGPGTPVVIGLHGNV